MIVYMDVCYPLTQLPCSGWSPRTCPPVAKLILSFGPIDPTKLGAFGRAVFTSRFALHVLDPPNVFVPPHDAAWWA